MLALNLYTTPSNNGGIVLYMDADLGDLGSESLNLSGKSNFISYPYVLYGLIVHGKK